MEKQYTKLMKRCIQEDIDDSADNIKKMQRLLPNYKIVFEGPFNMDERCSVAGSAGGTLTLATGVYQIVHKFSKIIYYVGKGVIQSRKSRHKQVFLNNGKVIISDGGTATDSPVAKRMYAKDSNLSNWEFWYTRIPDSNIMNRFEEALIIEMEPPFNDLTMAGKG